MLDDQNPTGNHMEPLFFEGDVRPAPAMNVGIQVLYVDMTPVIGVTFQLSI